MTIIGASPPAAELSAGKQGVVWADVWSRSGTKYRVRAVVMLSINVLLFCGVGLFAFWLRSGRILAPTTQSYWEHLAETFQFTGKSGISLGSFLVEPISVQDVPAQIIILGLLMATLIGIPILVSVLYRFWSSLPFIAIVGFLAVMPWLAISLLGSCVIASVGPFRTPFRFVSALLALVPAVIYLFLASAGTGEAIAGKIDPVDTTKLVAPWIAAVVCAAVLFAVVLALAKVVDYRTGAITPLLAIMFLLPVVLFELYVGRDELHYRLLESLADAHFEDADASAELDLAAQLRWEALPLPKPRWSEVYEVEEQKWHMALAADLQPFETELDRHRGELIERCDRFVHQFPDSRYASNVLYLKAKAQDTRVDAGEFRRTKWVRFYDDFPSDASALTWRTILDNRPDSVLSAAALLRLAQLDARGCDVVRARSKLATLLERFETTGPVASIRSSHGGLTVVLTRREPELSLRVPLAQLILHAKRLRDLLQANADPVYDYDPLCGSTKVGVQVTYGLLDLDPRDEAFARQLQDLRQQYPKARIRDNIDLAWALVTPSPAERIERLGALTQGPADQDAMPEALYRLAESLRAVDRAADADAALARLVAEYPESVWAAVANSTLPRSGAVAQRGGAQ